MKALITFEHSSLPIHSVDLISILNTTNLEIDFLLGKVLPSIHDPMDFFKNNTNIIHEIKDIGDYDIWFFDLSSWEGEKTPYLDLLHKFKGVLICINYEDGYRFFQHKMDFYLMDKIQAYINNAVYVDRGRYDKRIRNKLILATSYVSNSQDFKNISIPFKNKEKRAIFTGSLTGSSETGNKIEENCRINIPLKLINAGKNCIFNIHGFDPSRKSVFDNFDIKYKKDILSREKFIELYSNSMIVLSIKGNGHTLNRYFEGQACGSLIFSTPFDKVVEFIGQGTSGKDYVEIDFSGDDVVEKIDYYLNHIDEAEKISKSGREVWDSFSKRDSIGLLPNKVVNKILSDIYFVTGIDLLNI